MSFDFVLEHAYLKDIEKAEVITCYVCNESKRRTFYQIWLDIDYTEPTLICTECRDKLILEFKESEAEEENYKREVIEEGAPSLEYLMGIK